MVGLNGHVEAVIVTIRAPQAVGLSHHMEGGYPSPVGLPADAHHLLVLESLLHILESPWRKVAELGVHGLGALMSLCDGKFYASEGYPGTAVALGGRPW